MKDWIERFDGLDRVEEGLRDALLSESTLRRYAPGEALFHPGEVPDNLLLLVEGDVRIQQVTEDGREIVLYRVGAGDSCVLTTACLMAFEDYSAEGIAETPVTAAAVPRATFEELIARSPEFRQFVFRSYSKRIADLFYVIEEIAFRRIDVRLAQRLLELADAKGRVGRTHAQLASELGSAREVISRQLKEFVRRGWVSSGRGAVTIVDREGLAHLAES